MCSIQDNRDCINRCKSIEHGNLITAALTKRGVSDADLCAYLQQLCCSCESVRDATGKVALQMAASCGRCSVVKWLVQGKRANINAKDDESGYTALHRSVFYGKIDVAVYLISQGANTALYDLNGLTCIEHAMKDCITATPFLSVSEGEVYVWGSNSNYTLGHQHARELPDLFDVFHRQHPNNQVRQVCLEKFHCVIVSSNGQVYACGHGQGGRLGLGTEKTIVAPERLHFKTNPNQPQFVCKSATIARDHSLFLSDYGQVWACGLNTFKVLGVQPPPNQILTPTPLPIFHKNITNVCAARYHSLAWGADVLFTWGYNVGQLGHGQMVERYVLRPKIVTSLSLRNGNQLVAVAASNGGTAAVTSAGDVFVLHEYQCRKIVSKQLNIVSISIIGGSIKDETLTGNNEKHELKVAALNNCGNIYLWQECDQLFSRCVFSLQRVLIVRQLSLNRNYILFATNDGEAFKATVKPRKKTVQSSPNEKSAFHKFIDRNDCLTLKLQKIPHIHRAISIYSDLEGHNYAALQVDPKRFQKEHLDIPKSTMDMDIKLLLQEADVGDTIHDVVFKVANRKFPAHKYIVSINSEQLRDLIAASCDRCVELPDVDPDIFEQLLTYFYSGTCALTQCGTCPQHLNGTKLLPAEALTERPKANENRKDPVRMLQELAKRFGVKTLHKRLENFYYDMGCIKNKRPLSNGTAGEWLRFGQELLPKMHDVDIVSREGKTIAAHKCILAARLQYFNNLFSRWQDETCTRKQIKLDFAYNLLKSAIHFVYTDEIALESEDIDSICNLLIVADHFFIARLRELCEFALCSHVTLKNVAQMLSLSCLYNAGNLKNWCMEFICLNLPIMLESKCLECLDRDMLKDVREFYCLYFPVMQHRIITPFSYAPSDDVIFEAGLNNSTTLLDDSDEEVDKIITKPIKRRSRNRKSSSSAAIRNHDKLDGNAEIDVMDKEIKTKDPIVEDNKENVISVTQHRLQTIVAAQDAIVNSKIETNYVKIVSSRSQFNSNSLDNFPELNTSKGNIKINPITQKLDFKKKMPKLSQKQRKRLSSENSQNGDVNTSELSKSPQSPWKTNCEISDSVDASKSNIDSIISDLKKERENFVKMKTKKLVLTQMEDKAIDELYKFYNAENVYDEIVTISRVDVGLIAAPVWVNRN